MFFFFKNSGSRKEQPCHRSQLQCHHRQGEGQRVHELEEGKTDPGRQIREVQEALKVRTGRGQPIRRPLQGRQVLAGKGPSRLFLFHFGRLLLIRVKVDHYKWQGFKTVMLLSS